MAYEWKGQSFDRFDKAAEAWLEHWMEEGGCGIMGDSIKTIPALTLEEWKKEVTTDIHRFHCGRCGGLIEPTHNAVIGELFDEIKKI